MKGKCVNLDCSEFDENSKKIQDIPDGEDFVCRNPECGHQLKEVTDEENPLKEWIKEHKMLLIIAVSIILVVGIAAWLLLKPAKEPTPEPVPTKEVVSVETVEEQSEAGVQGKDTVYIIKDTVITDTVIIEKETVREVTTTGRSNTKTYSFGNYSGELKNGHPEGQGTMVYTKRVRIARHDNEEHYVEAGYSLTGTWINGDIANGKIKDNNGNSKVILPGARNSVYDLENDTK